MRGKYSSKYVQNGKKKDKKNCKKLATQTEKEKQKMFFSFRKDKINRN